MVWNYKGYGRNKGKPSPYNAKTDAEAVYTYLRNDLGVTGKIGVLGRSIGGIPTCHLAYKFDPDLVIADRTLSTLKDLATEKFGGAVPAFLMKIFSLGWECFNDHNFDVSKAGYKLQCADPSDDVIDNMSSLHYGIAKKNIPSPLFKDSEAKKFL